MKSIHQTGKSVFTDISHREFVFHFLRFNVALFLQMSIFRSWPY